MFGVLIGAAALAGLAAQPVLGQQAPARRPMTAADIAGWQEIVAPKISADGKWLGYVMGSEGGPAEVVIQSTGAGREWRAPTTSRWSAFTFSRDGRWVAYPSVSKAGAPTTAPGLTLIELGKGREIALDGVRNFRFASPRARTLILETPADSGWVLRLYDLASGKRITLADVDAYELDSTETYLAWTGARGRGIHVRNLATGAEWAVDSAGTYRGLAWAAGSHEHLAAFKIVVGVSGDTAYQVAAFTGVTTAGMSATFYDPATDAAFPKDLRIEANGRPRWSDDRAAVYFGLKPTAARAATDSTPADEKVDLVIWNSKDDRLQSEQAKQQAMDDGYTYLASYRLREHRFVRLATDSLRTVQALGARWALGVDRTPYARENSTSGQYHADYYVVDLATGARRLLVRRHLYTVGMRDAYRALRYFPSPDGEHLLTWTDGVYTVYDLATGKSRPLVAGPSPSFAADSTDHTPHHADYAPLAWTLDGRVALISDRWDLWAAPLDGGAAVNLTVNGKRDGIRYYVADMMMPQGQRWRVDLAKPWYVTMASVWGKETGIGRIEGRTPGVRRLLWVEGEVDAQKAAASDAVIYARGSAVDYPDMYLSDVSFKRSRRLTNANPQTRGLLWPSGTAIVEYKGPSGERLQASLLLPANYEKGKRYPAIVEIYEQTSFMRNRYTSPSDPSAVNPTLYAARGYVVISPDIHYLADHPGTSAATCVLGAARAAVAAGFVDSARVGLTGHSFGGYETAFIVSRTPFFRAAVAGSAFTDLISSYGSVYRGFGSAGSEMHESDQGRTTKPFWRDPETYLRESTVFHVEAIETPLVLMSNDKDDAVSWTQGLELFNAMRRVGKPVVLLQYVGEGHGLSRPVDQTDYRQRVQEFFDHFLMDAPAPAWWTDGVPYRRREEDRRARVEARRTASMETQSR